MRKISLKKYYLSLMVFIAGTAILAIDATLRDVFIPVYVRARIYGLTNFVFYATVGGLELDEDYISISIPSDGIVITDDYNPVEVFSTKAMEGWKKSNLRRFGNEIIA